MVIALILKSGQKRTLRALPLVQSALLLTWYLFWPDKTQVHQSLSTLLDFQLFFCRFLANQRPSIVPPYAPRTNADVRETPSTSHAIRAAHVSAYAPPPRHIDTTYLVRISTCTMATDDCASAASEIEVGSIYPTFQVFRAAAAKQATFCVTCCWCGVVWDAEGGGGLSVRGHSYTRRRHVVELWRSLIG